MLPLCSWDPECREDVLQIYDFAPSLSYMDHCTFHAPRLVRTFALPISRKNLRDVSLFTHVSSLDTPFLYDRRRDSAASTSTSSSMSDLHRQFPLAKKPFYDSSTSRLCAIVLFSRSKEGWAYLFLVHAEILLSNRFNEYFDAAPDEPIPWSVWGSQNAACLYGLHFSQRDLWDAYGDRVAILEPDWSHTGRTTAANEIAPNTTRGKAVRGGSSYVGQPPQTTIWRLVVLDFNQDRVRRLLNKESWPMDDTSPAPRRNIRPPRVKQTVQDWQERSDECFGDAYEVITAKLPYIEIVHSKKIVGSRRPRIFIDSEHIVLNYVSIAIARF